MTGPGPAPKPITSRYARRPKRLIDAELDSWPVTGFVCSVCGWPVDRIWHSTRRHPTCEPADVLIVSRPTTLAPSDPTFHADRLEMT
jgi:hypothetical protein